MRYVKLKKLLTSLRLNHNHVFSVFPFWIMRPIINYYYGNVWYELPAGVNALFIHIPKCAGTSVTRVLYGKDMGHRPAALYLAADPTRFRNIPSFAIMRNPYDRFCSIFNHNKCPRYDSKHNIIEESLCSRFDSPREFAHALGDDKGLANTFVSHIIARPQVDWIKVENKVAVDHLFAYEKLEELQDFLSIQLRDRSFRLPHANASGRRRSWDEELDEHAKLTIYNLYKEDFRLWATLSLRRNAGLTVTNEYSRYMP